MSAKAFRLCRNRAYVSAVTHKHPRSSPSDVITTLVQHKLHNQGNPMRNQTPRALDLDQEPERELGLDELNLDALPTETEDGLIAPMISEDPEHDRVIDPED